MRLLGMYFEQAGLPAFVCVLLLSAALGIALLYSFPMALVILLLTLFGFPWKAMVRTAHGTSRLEGVKLPRNQAVTTLYFPGLGNDGTQMMRYMEHSTFPGALGLLVNPICIQPYDAHDFRKFNAAQKGDLPHALNQVHAIMRAKPHDRFILFGTSRGAAVALSVASSLHPEQISRVAFTVCEGLFDTAPDIMKARFYLPVARFLNWILPKVTEYDPEHKTPPLWIAKHFVNRDHPVLLVSSLVDQVVPHANTRHVFQYLKQQITTTELLTLNESPHSSYATWKDADRQVYVSKIQEWINAYV